jgi:glyoxylase-like metal-dependent hydrolase (beta-lactamase superfamily II)
VLELGGLRITALAVPGHTPADMAFLVEDAVFVGDTLFMPDVGTARADFPGGSARALYRSIRKLLALPPATRMFVCHDYPPATRAAAWETTVARQRAANIHVRDAVTEQDFVDMRTARDRTLAVPRLLYPAIRANVCAGRVPNQGGGCPAASQDQFTPWPAASCGSSRPCD